MDYITIAGTLKHFTFIAKIRSGFYKKQA